MVHFFPHQRRIPTNRAWANLVQGRQVVAKRLEACRYLMLGDQGLVLLTILPCSRQGRQHHVQSRLYQDIHRANLPPFG